VLKNAFRANRGGVTLAQGVLAFLMASGATSSPADPPLATPTQPPDLVAASDLGISSTDNITSTTTPTFSSTGAIPGQTVTVYAGTTSLGTTTAATDGTWTFAPTTAMALGAYTIRWTQGTGVRESAVSPSLDITIAALGSRSELPFTASTQWTTATPDGDYWFDLCGTGTAVQEPMVGGQVLIATLVAAGTGSSRAVVTGGGNYTINWGDGTTRTQANYAPRTWAAAGPYTVRVYSSNPASVTGLNFGQSAYRSVNASRTLCQLQFLYANINQLTVAPTLPPEWVAMRQLYLFANILTVAPTLPPEWVAMQQLYLHTNRLTVAPILPPEWVAMQRLHLHTNQLTVAPTLPPEWVAMQQLYLHTNQLTVAPILPPEWVAMQQLYLQLNQLTVAPILPTQWGAMLQLHLHNNQLPAAELNALFNNLGNPAFTATGKAVNTSGNPGSPTVDATALAAATTRGWAVTNTV
jgi:hypothetical protein